MGEGTGTAGRPTFGGRWAAGVFLENSALTEDAGQLSNAQQSLNEMQDAIQQVRQAHIASLVSRSGFLRDEVFVTASLSPQSRLDTTPNSAAARETDQLIASTRALTAANKDKIKQLNKMAKDKAQKQQVAATKSRFMGLLNEYQVVEKEFRKKVRERGERQFKIGGWGPARQGCRG